MKQILHILFCAVIVAAITSCGNRGNGNETSEEGLGNKEKKELKQALKKIKIRVEEKGNQIIKSVDSPYGTNMTVLTFEGDKCIGCKETLCFQNEAIAKENFEGLKEVNDETHNLKTLTQEGSKIIYEHGERTLNMMYQGMTRTQVLEQVKEEVEQAKKLLK